MEGEVLMLERIGFSNKRLMNVLIYDIETLVEYFLIGIYNPETGEYIEFSINKDCNDIYAFVKFAEMHSDYYWVGFNNLSFDAQVLEYIIRRHQFWADMSRLELSEWISEYADNLIDDSKHRLRAPYAEHWLHLKQIDLFKIHHFDNENKRTSLKWCEFTMNFEHMEDMPFSHRKRNLTAEELEKVRFYCKNDVMATYELYRWTIGETEHPEYKGKNRIQDRLNLMEETGLQCLNWSDVTIGEEWNRKDYTDLTGVKGRDLYPKKVRHFYGMKYKEFFPKHVEFQTEKVKNFIEKMGNTYITRGKNGKKQMFKLEIGGNIVSLGRGGIHSSEGPRFLQSDENFVYIQVDIGSQYPNTYRKLGLFPKHLGKEANEMVVRKIKRRLNDKALYKKTKEPKYKALEEMGKLALNGGLYGKLKQKGSFLEDHVCQLQITMCCQLDILMIVEALVVEGHRVVSLNTDGFDVIVNRNRLKEFYSTCSKYEELIGNSGEGNGNLEYTEFDWIAQLSVSGYLAKKTADGTLKKKKEFITDAKLNESPNRRIVPLALEAYYDRGEDPRTFVLSHKNIFDFCIGIKSTKDYEYKTVNRATGEEIIHSERALRYFLSTDGLKLFKIKKEGSDAKGNDIEECEAPEDGIVRLCTIANNIDKSKDISSYNVDYEYYIGKIEKIIAQIGARKKKIKKQNPHQIKLF